MKNEAEYFNLIFQGKQKTTEISVVRVGDFEFPVENIGVEPMTSCMPCKRSSQLS